MISSSRKTQMQNAILLIVCLALCAVVFAAPPTPTFPREGRTGFYFHDKANASRDHYGEWYFSEPYNAEKIHGVLRDEEIIQLRRFNEKKLYLIVTPRDRRPSHCTVHPLKEDKLDLPNFQNYTYVGEARRDNEVADEWRDAREGIEYYDVARTQSPLEFDRKDITLTFRHFEKGRLPESDFSVPSSCNKIEVLESKESRDTSIHSRFSFF